MFAFFNILIVGLVLLIAYWWANQGLFSALLHLLCVVIAGAISLGLWEFFVVDMFLTGGKFDLWAWGITLIGVFALSLFLLRFAMDKLAPGNVALPQWANLAFGFPVGAAAGVLTMGIVVIGAGFMQSHYEIMGFRGWSRAERTGKVEEVNTLWLPVHTLTANFYEFLSVGALWSPKPLKQYNPYLDRQATLVRDSFGQGKGQLSLAPDAAKVTVAAYDATDNQAVVAVEFDADARDYNSQLTLSSSQVRLIGSSRGKDAPVVVHPDLWMQPTKDAPFGAFTFDDVSHYATSVPGQQTANVVFRFSTPPNFTPKFIQIRGTRFDLPRVAPGENVNPMGLLAGGGGPAPDIDRSAPNISAAVKIDERISEYRGLTNNDTSGAFSLTEDRYIIDGEFTLRGRGGGGARSKNAIQGINTPDGTRIVQIDIGRGSPANIFSKRVTDRVEDDSKILLVDASGATYTAIGFFYERPDQGKQLKIDPGTRFDNTSLLPRPSTTHQGDLRLIFQVTEGATLDALTYGDITVGTFNGVTVTQ